MTHYKFLEIVFTTNRSGSKGDIEKLRNSLNELPGATLVNGYDNGARFLVNTEVMKGVIPLLNVAGFTVIQTGKMEDTKSLVAIIEKTSSQSFQDISHSRMSKLWE